MPLQPSVSRREYASLSEWMECVEVKTLQLFGTPSADQKLWQDTFLTVPPSRFDIFEGARVDVLRSDYVDPLTPLTDAEIDDFYREYFASHPEADDLPFVPESDGPQTYCAMCRGTNLEIDNPDEECELMEGDYPVTYPSHRMVPFNTSEPAARSRCRECDAAVNDRTGWCARCYAANKA